MDSNELEAELIKRNREIARARDDVAKVERRLEDAQLRNDELLERNAELDADCTRAKQKAKDLETRVESLEDDLKNKCGDADSLRAVYDEKLETALAEAKAATEQAAALRNDETNKKLEATIEEIQVERRRLTRELEDERSKHVETKAALQQCEGSLRENASRSAEQKRKIAQLEEEKQHFETTAKEESKGKENAMMLRNGQLENDYRKASHRVSEVEGRLEAQRHTIDQLGETLKEMQMERDMLREEKATMEQQFLQEKGSRDEVKAEFQGAVEEVQQRLQEMTQQRDELKERTAVLEREGGDASGRVKELEEKLADVEEKSNSKMQSLTVRNAQIEGQLRARHQELLEVQGRLDAQGQYVEQVGEMIQQLRGDRDALMETKGSLEAQLKLERESSGAAHQQAVDEVTKRCQGLEEKMMADREAHREAIDEVRRTNAEQKGGLESDLRQKQEQLEELEKTLTTVREELQEKVDHHATETKKAEKELESLTVFYRDEAQKLQGEVEDARNEREAHVAKVAQLEEGLKETKAEMQEKIDSGDARCRQLEAELTQQRAAVEEAGRRERDVQDRKESVDKELRATSERVVEVEGRCDEQRRYLEQVQENIKQLQTDRDSLMEQKGLLEAQVKVEQATRETAISTQSQALEEANRRSRELEDRIMRDRDAQREAMDEYRQSSQERVSAIELELRMKTERFEDLEKVLASTREELEGKVLHSQMESQRAEQDLQALLKSYKEDAEKLKQELTDTQSQKEAHAKRVLDLETQHRENQAGHQDYISAAEAKANELEREISTLKVIAEEDKAFINRQLEEATAQVKGLEERLRQEVEAVEVAQMAKATAEAELHRKDKGVQQGWECLAMASEELRTRQSDFALERQRLSGALEESRRTLRNSLGVMGSQPSAVNTARIASLEAQLADAKRKAGEQSEALQRAQERFDELSGMQGRDSDDRHREVERRCAALDDELVRAHSAKALLEQGSKEARECAAMALEEMVTVRYEARCDAAKLRGALDQLRFMLKVSGLPTGSGTSSTTASTPLSRPSMGLSSLDRTF